MKNGASRDSGRAIFYAQPIAFSGRFISRLLGFIG
jgi:hypothetical protein